MCVIFYTFEQFSACDEAWVCSCTPLNKKAGVSSLEHALFNIKSL